jgi:hypothetical protein
VELPSRLRACLGQRRIADDLLDVGLPRAHHWQNLDSAKGHFSRALVRVAAAGGGRTPRSMDPSPGYGLGTPRRARLPVLREGESLRRAEVSGGHHAGVRLRWPTSDCSSQAPSPRRGAIGELAGRGPGAAWPRSPHPRRQRPSTAVSRRRERWRSDAMRRQCPLLAQRPRVAVNRPRPTERAAPLRHTPSASISACATFRPEYCCWPVMSRPSRTTNALNRPPWT